MLLWRRDVQGGGPVGQAGGLARKAPLGRDTLENKQELASNEECTLTRYCRACCNGTGTDHNRASWNGFGRDVHRYAKDHVQLYCTAVHNLEALMVRTAFLDPTEHGDLPEPNGHSRPRAFRLGEAELAARGTGIA